MASDAHYKLSGGGVEISYSAVTTESFWRIHLMSSKELIDSLTY
jgi:hypothetical protein